MQVYFKNKQQRGQGKSSMILIIKNSNALEACRGIICTYCDNGKVLPFINLEKQYKSL